MKNFTLAICAGLICVIASNVNLEARPNYNKITLEVYKDNAKITEAKCMTCHTDKDDKKPKNDYGKAVGKALGGSKVTDVAKVKEALEKAAAEKREDGKTFGEVIKAGELPGTAKK